MLQNHDLEVVWLTTRLAQRIGLLLGHEDRKNFKQRNYDFPVRLIDSLPPNLEFLRLYCYRKGTSLEVDIQVRELMDVKEQRFPHLAVVEGVDEFLPGVAGTYGPEPHEDNVWVRPESGLDWAEAHD